MMDGMYIRLAVMVLYAFAKITLIDGGGGGKEKSLICYYNAETLNRPTEAKLHAFKIDPFLCTHIVYSYAGISEENTLTFPSGLDSLQSLKRLKVQNSKLKILIAVGGPDVQYGEMVKEQEFRSKFIKNVTNFLAKQRLDGISLDWEWPGDQVEDRENFSKLLLEMRRSFRTNYLMMSTVSPNKNTIESGYNTRELFKNLDFLTIRAYGFRKANGKTAPHSALYGSGRFDKFKDDQVRNVNWTVSYWLEQEAFSKVDGGGGGKLILGVALYGTTYKLELAKVNRFDSPTVAGNDGGPFTQFGGMLAYNEIRHLNRTRNYKWILVRDSDYKVPYAIYGSLWVTYDDLESLSEKASYVMARNLAGMSVMSLDFDDFNGTYHAKTFALTRKMAEILNLTPNQAPTSSTTTTTTKRPIKSTTEAPATRKPARPTSTTSATTEATTTKIRTDIDPTTSTTTRRPKTTSTTAKSKPPTGADGVEPICGDAGMWYFPGPNCRQYYDCSLSETPTLKTCPEEMIWKQSELWCDLQINVPECQYVDKLQE